MAIENVAIEPRPTPPSPVQVEPFIDKRELARLLGKTVRSVDTYMAKGLIPFYKLGRAVVFRYSEVVAHMAANHRVCLRRS